MLNCSIYRLLTLAATFVKYVGALFNMFVLGICVCFAVVLVLSRLSGFCIVFGGFVKSALTAALTATFVEDVGFLSSLLELCLIFLCVPFPVYLPPPPSPPGPQGGANQQ